MDGFDPDFLPADPAAIAKARADALARRSHGKGRKAPVTPATSTDSGCRITWETAC